MAFIKCLNCEKSISDKVSECPFCKSGTTTEIESTAIVNKNEKLSEQQPPPPQNASAQMQKDEPEQKHDKQAQTFDDTATVLQDLPVVSILNTLSALLFFLGLFMCLEGWPAYVQSVIWLSTGIVGSLVLYAFGLIVQYLHAIEGNTRISMLISKRDTIKADSQSQENSEVK